MVCVAGVPECTLVLSDVSGALILPVVPLRHAKMSILPVGTGTVYLVPSPRALASAWVVYTGVSIPGSIKTTDRIKLPNLS